MALQCQSFCDKFYHIQNLFKFYYELNDIDKIKILRGGMGMREREREKEQKRKHPKKAYQLQNKCR